MKKVFQNNFPKLKNIDFGKRKWHSNRLGVVHKNKMNLARYSVFKSVRTSAECYDMHFAIFIIYIRLMEVVLIRLESIHF